MIFKLNGFNKLNILYSEKLANRINNKYQEGNFLFIKNEDEKTQLTNTYLYVDKNRLWSKIKNIELDDIMDYEFGGNTDIKIMYKNFNNNKDIISFMKTIKQIKYIAVYGWQTYINHKKYKIK